MSPVDLAMLALAFAFIACTACAFCYQAGMARGNREGDAAGYARGKVTGIGIGINTQREQTERMRFARRMD